MSHDQFHQTVQQFEELEEVCVGGVDPRDYPDFSDAYIESAMRNSLPLTEAELGVLNEDRDFVHVKAHESLY